MDEEHKPETDLTDEFRQLGNNLKDTLQSAWESEERKKFQEEIETGLLELGKLLKQTSEEFDTSQVKEDIKTGMDDLRDRIRGGEIETQVREELLNTLRAINLELSQLMNRLSDQEDHPTPPE